MFKDTLTNTEAFLLFPSAFISMNWDENLKTIINTDLGIDVKVTEFSMDGSFALQFVNEEDLLLYKLKYK